MELDFIDKCNDFNAPVNPPNPDPPIINQVPPPLTLEDVIAQAEELYGNMLDSLIAQGDYRAIKRVYALGAQLQRIKYTRVEQRYIGGGTDESMPPNWHNINL